MKNIAKKLSLICNVILLCSFFNMSIYGQEVSTEIKEAGTYKVRLYDSENKTSTEIKVTVLFPRTVENKDLHEAIDAQDIKLEKGVFATLSDTQLITLANARAWNTQTNESITITTVEPKIVDEKAGLYQVTFATANKTSTTINVIETIQANIREGITDQYFNIIKFQVLNKYLFLYSLLIILPLIILIIMLVISHHKKKEYEKLLYEK